MDGIKLLFDDLDALEPLGDAEKGRLFTALLVYGKTGEAPQLGGNERFLFPMMRARIDRERAAEMKISQARRDAGRKGNQAKLAKSANAGFAKKNQQMPDFLSRSDFAEIPPSPFSPPAPSPSPPTPPSSSSITPVLTPTPKEKPPKGGKKKVPAPPTLGGAKPPAFEQVLEVAKLRGCTECAKPFFDYYAAAGWRDSEGKPCAWNWQQKLIAWQMRAQERKKPDPKQKQPDPNDWKEFSL